jgi:hypothetical protein
MTGDVVLRVCRKGRQDSLSNLFRHGNKGSALRQSDSFLRTIKIPGVREFRLDGCGQAEQEDVH